LPPRDSRGLPCLRRWSPGKARDASGGGLRVGRAELHTAHELLGLGPVPSTPNDRCSRCTHNLWAKCPLDGLSWDITSAHAVPEWALGWPIERTKTRIRFPAPPPLRPHPGAWIPLEPMCFVTRAFTVAAALAKERRDLAWAVPVTEREHRDSSRVVSRRLASLRAPHGDLP
jgi:hypothetical protein